MAGCCFARLCHTTAASQREGGGGADSEANGGSGLLDTSKGGRERALPLDTCALLPLNPRSQDARRASCDRGLRIARGKIVGRFRPNKSKNKKAKILIFLFLKEKEKYVSNFLFHKEMKF